MPAPGDPWPDPAGRVPYTRTRDDTARRTGSATASRGRAARRAPVRASRFAHTPAPSDPATACRAARGLQCGVVPPRPQICRGDVHAMHKRIELLRALQQRDRLIMAPDRPTQAPVEVVCVRTPGIQLERTLELLLRTRPVEFVNVLEIARRRVRVAQLRVERKRARDGRSSPRIRLLGSD